jgi:hypothetical protein
MRMKQLRHSAAAAANSMLGVACRHDDDDVGDGNTRFLC